MKKVVFSGQARGDVRKLDIPTAKRIFAALQRFAETGSGDVKKLEGETDDLRLRIGDLARPVHRRTRTNYRQACFSPLRCLSLTTGTVFTNVSLLLPQCD